MSASNGRPKEYDTELLLVLPLPIGQDSEGLLFESQALNGMARWLENFGSVQVMCPVIVDDSQREALGFVWKRVSDLGNEDRVKFVTLPYAPSLSAFLRAYSPSRAVIRRAIDQSRYLCFSIGGLFGDWGAIACLEAKRMGRPYAVWTDRVEHKVCQMVASHSKSWQRLKCQMRARLMYSLERRCISHASLGLFHGATCYSEYAPWCRMSYVVHDVHAKPADAITSDQLEDKCSRIAAGEQLTILYVGRADKMKSPFDWLAALSCLRERGLSFRATWLGDGPMLADMRKEVVRLDLEDVVSLPGFVDNREELLSQIRKAHIFMFCHKTPESPRNLVEALISGCPIVGYHSEFAADLAADGGGEFVALNDTKSLADAVCRLDANRSELVALTRKAAMSGRKFNDVSVFQHRSELIKAHL
jgi:colanic acid/amylovoran biosynthesis glycosyltransferase